MATTAINVNYVDNELYIIAIPSTSMASIELFHYKSGYYDGMKVTISPQHVLSSGRYTLLFYGINWGGPGKFDVSLTTDGKTAPVPSTESSTVGGIWNASVANHRLTPGEASSPATRLAGSSIRLERATSEQSTRYTKSAHQMLDARRRTVPSPPSGGGRPVPCRCAGRFGILYQPPELGLASPRIHVFLAQQRHSRRGNGVRTDSRN